MDDLDICKNSKVPKLVADFHPKQRYILHGSILLRYIQLGIKVCKIHNIVSFKQACWMSKFLEFNTEQRSKANSDFEKDFWKLLSNSAFGKTIEQVRKRSNVKIVTSREQALRYIKKPTLQNIIPINASTCIMLLKKLCVKLNKPIATGSVILDLAKEVMYNHHYNVMKSFYGDKATLLYTDTDSFIYKIQTEDIYKDMQQYLYEHFDMSKYKNSPVFRSFYDNKNENVSM